MLGQKRVINLFSDSAQITKKPLIKRIKKQNEKVVSGMSNKISS